MYSTFATLRVVRYERAAISVNYLQRNGYWFAFRCDDSGDFTDMVAAIKSLCHRGEYQWRKDAPGGQAWWISDLGMGRLLALVPTLPAAIRAFQQGSGSSESGRSRFRGSNAHRASSAGTAGASSSRATAAHSLSPKVRDAFEVLCLAPNAPKPIIEAAWRAWLKLTHPDAGGDLAQAKRVNAAHDVIEHWLDSQPHVA